MRKRPCEHENADHLLSGDTFEPWVSDDVAVIRSVAQCEQFRCLGCEAWLSLGPSNDKPEAVQIEIRAADIAADRADVTPEEMAGWLLYTTPDDGLDWAFIDVRTGTAGYLADCIATHEEP